MKDCLNFGAVKILVWNKPSIWESTQLHKVRSPTSKSIDSSDRGYSSDWYPPNWSRLVCRALQPQPPIRLVRFQPDRFPPHSWHLPIIQRTPAQDSRVHSSRFLRDVLKLAKWLRMAANGCEMAANSTNQCFSRPNGQKRVNIYEFETPSSGQRKASFSPYSSIRQFDSLNFSGGGHAPRSRQLLCVYVPNR